MRGMILAAGRGQRMGQLTDHTPKPLLRIGENLLIEYAIRSMTAIGINDIIINVSYHRDQIKSTLGNGKKYNVVIHYSDEEEALETGGGILQALPLLGKDPFVVLSADVISSYDLNGLPKTLSGLAHLVLVDNPAFHPHGDFNLLGNKVTCDAPHQYTYANIGLIDPKLFSHCKPGKFKLGDLLKNYAKQNLVTGEYFNGFWRNLGTPAQLTELRNILATT